METICDYKPFIRNNSFAFGEENGAGNWRFISKKYPDLNYITLNNSAKRLIESCNGKTLNSILTDLYEKYPSTEKNLIFDDTMYVLLKLWRLGIIEWDNGLVPFFLSDSFDEHISFKLLTDDEAIRILATEKVESCFISYDFDIHSEYSERLIRQNWYSYNHMYFSVIEDSLTVCMICLSFSSYLQAFDVVYMNMYNHFVLTDSILDGLMKFIKSCCEKTIPQFKKMMWNNVELYFTSHEHSPLLDNLSVPLVGKLNRESFDDAAYIYKLALE